MQSASRGIGLASRCRAALISLVCEDALTTHSTFSFQKSAQTDVVKRANKSLRTTWGRMEAIRGLKSCPNVCGGSNATRDVIVVH